MKYCHVQEEEYLKDLPQLRSTQVPYKTISSVKDAYLEDFIHPTPTLTRDFSLYKNIRNYLRVY